jgi:hypothetical protein
MTKYALITSRLRERAANDVKIPGRMGKGVGELCRYCWVRRGAWAGVKILIVVCTGSSTA